MIQLKLLLAIISVFLCLEVLLNVDLPQQALLIDGQVNSLQIDVSACSSQALNQQPTGNA